jgi:hypothetical protein
VLAGFLSQKCEASLIKRRPFCCAQDLCSDETPRLCRYVTFITGSIAMVRPSLRTGCVYVTEVADVTLSRRRMGYMDACCGREGRGEEA